MAVGSQRFIEYARLDGDKVFPEGKKFQRIRTTGGAGITNARTTVESQIIRGDRQRTDVRLGNNAPDTALPTELHYGAWDPIFQGALGGKWIGGTTETLTLEATVGDILTLSGERFSDYYIYAGAYVRIEGATENQGIIAQISAIEWDPIEEEDNAQLVDFNGDPVTLTAITEAVEILSGHYAAEDTVTVVATAGTITGALDWEEVGVEEGDKLLFAGFVEADNNGWKTVSKVDGTTITVDEDLVNEGPIAVSYITNTGFLTVGTDLEPFALHEGFQDVVSGEDIDGLAITAGAYHYSLGNYVDNFAINFQPDSTVSLDVNMQGLTYSGFKTDSITADGNVYANTFEPETTTAPFDSYTGKLRIPGAEDMEGVVMGLNFTSTGNLNRRYALMQRDGISMGDGRAQVDGTIDAYFETPNLSNRFENEETFAIAIRTQDLEGNSYTFGFPRCKLQNDGRSITENDVTISSGFTALGGEPTDKKKTLYILKQPATPVA